MALLRAASLLLRPALRATQAAVLAGGATAAPLAAASSEEARRRLHSARSAALTRIVRAMLAYVGASVTVVAASDVGGDGVYAREMDRSKGPHMHNARGIMRMTATVRSRVHGAINPAARPESPMHGFMYTKVPRATEASISSSPHNPGLAAAGLPPLPPGALQFTDARNGVRGGAVALQTACTHGQQEMCDNRRPRKRGRRVGVRRWGLPEDCNLASHCPGAIHRSRGMLRTSSANAISTAVDEACDRTNSAAGLRSVLPPAEQPTPGDAPGKDAQPSVDGVLNALGEALVLAQSRAREAEAALDEAQAELQQLRLQLRWRAKDEAWDDQACQIASVLGVHFECMDTQGDVVTAEDLHGVHVVKAVGASVVLCSSCHRMIDEAADTEATAEGAGWPWHLLHIGVAVTCISAGAVAAMLWLRAPSYLAQSLLVNGCVVTAAGLIV